MVLSNWYNFLRCSDRIDTTEIEIDCGTSVSCGSCRETCTDLSEQDPDDSFSRIVGKYRFEGNIAKGTSRSQWNPAPGKPEISVRCRSSGSGNHREY